MKRLDVALIRLAFTIAIFIVLSLFFRVKIIESNVVEAAGPAVGVPETMPQLLQELPKLLKNLHISSDPNAAFKEGMVWGVLFAKHVQPYYKENENILSGIRGLFVLVEDVNPQAQEYGLTSQVLKTDIELRLRQHGIKVLSQQEALDYIDERCQEQEKYTLLLLDEIQDKSYEEFLQSLGECFQRSEHLLISMLSVNVNVIIDSSGLVYSIDMQLNEDANTVIWESGSLGTVSLSRVKSVRESVRDHVDKFINAYLAANPREGIPISSPTTTSPTVSPPTTKLPQKGLVSVITYSKDKPAALINNKIVHEGDIIDGVTVVKIHDDRVIFEKEYKGAILSWTQKIGEQPDSAWTR